MGHGLGDECEDAIRNLETGMMLLGSGCPAPENFQPQLFAEHADFDREPAGQARAYALLEAFEIGRWSVGGNHHLAARVDQGVERVAELRLRRFALKKLQVIDHQDINGAQRLLERQCTLRPQRGDEAVHEFFRGEIEHLALGGGVAGPGHRLQQMGLAQADAGMNV